jgi:hypothetical protein
MLKNYKWCVIAMLWFVCFLNYADRQAVFVLFPLLRFQFHFSDMQLALLASSSLEIACRHSHQSNFSTPV